MSTTQIDRNNDTPVSLQNDRASGLRSSAAIKGPVRAVAETNITLSGEQTVDTEACVEEDRVICIGQTDATENGIYVVSTGEWQRAADFNRTDDVVTGTWTYVWGGTLAGTVYVVTNETDITIGTTEITFSTLLDLLGFVSTADLTDYALKASPALTGTPTAPTAADGTSTTQIATTAFVQGAITLLKNGVSAAFDTLAEIATALGRALYLDTADQVVTGGVRVTSLDLGTGAGTVTLDPGDRPLQHLTNNAAFTLAPGANTGSFFLDITNGASAGAITTSGWTKVVGAFTTTNAHKFRCSCSIGNGGSLLSIQALQ
jgi:hypothetical protein